MSTTLFAIVRLIAPVHAFLRRLPEVPFLRHGSAPAATPCPVALPANTGHACQLRPGTAPAHKSLVAPTLRVLRVMEAGQPAAHGGRMVISGRMADVCAELDRMAAREAALQP